MRNKTVDTVNKGNKGFMTGERTAQCFYRPVHGMRHLEWVKMETETEEGEPG